MVGTLVKAMLEKKPPLKMTNSGETFVCVECGAEVWRPIRRVEGEPALCATCLMLPGWMDDPELRERLGGLN